MIRASRCFAELRAKVVQSLQDGLLRRFLRHSSWVVLGQLGSSLLGLVQVAVLSRALGREGYGALVLITTSALTVRQLLSARVWEWTTTGYAGALQARDPAKAALALKAGLVTSAAMNAVAFIILALFAPLIERELLKGQVSVALVLAFSLTYLGSWTYDPCLGVLRASNHFGYLAAQSVLIAASRVVVLGATAWLTRDLGWLVVSYVALELGAGALMLFKASSVFSAAFSTPFYRVPTKGVIRTLLDQRRSLLFSSLLDALKIASMRADVLLLGFFATPSAVAVYQAANNIIEGLSRAVSPISLVLFSDLARKAAQGDMSRLIRTLRRSWVVGMVAGCLAAAAVFVVADPLVSAIYGSAYQGAAPVLRILAIELLWLSTLWVQPAFASLGKLEWSLELVLIATAVKLALLPWLLPSSAEHGLAIANAAYYALQALLGPWYISRIRRHASLAAIQPPALRSP